MVVSRGGATPHSLSNLQPGAEAANQSADADDSVDGVR